MPRGRKAAGALAVLGALGAAFLLLSRTTPLLPSAIPPRTPDLANGEALFHAGSCLGCHRPPDDTGRDPALPSGGAPLPTPIGTFYPQNLTPDRETGIGAWSEADFVNAVTRGISPEGGHYFPAFPYPAYRFMKIEDVLDLRGYLMSRPAVRAPNRAQGVPLAGVLRRGVGLWKRLALRDAPAFLDPGKNGSWNRGAYLVNAPGHCAECHTPRNALFAADFARKFAGGPHPGGEGEVPSLRRLLARGRYKNAGDLALALQYGETMGYDKLSSGGMARIQESLSGLSAADLRAMSEYLVSLD